MDFVTKKEYETAVDTIKKALKCKQLQYVNPNQDTKVIFDHFIFGTSYDTMAPTAITFVPASQAIKDILFELRNQITIARENNASQEKILKELEQKEQKLVTQLPTLKE